MNTAEFGRGIAQLEQMVSEYGNTAIMCAEAVWWKCHRRLIADHLANRGVEVWHIMAPDSLKLHTPALLATLTQPRK